MNAQRLTCSGVAAAALLAGASVGLAEGGTEAAAKRHAPRATDDHPELQAEAELAVETTHFTDREALPGTTENLKVLGRFTRVGPATINYLFTIEDPVASTRSCSDEIPLGTDNHKICEYACRAGNFALPGILAGARKHQKAKAAADNGSTSR